MSQKPNSVKISNVKSQNFPRFPSNLLPSQLPTLYYLAEPNSTQQASYRKLRKAFKSSFHFPGTYYLLSKTWVQRWKKSAGRPFYERYNHEIIDWEKGRRRLRQDEHFLRGNLAFGWDLIVVSREIMDLIDSRCQGDRVLRFLPRIPPEQGFLYPFELEMILITDELMAGIDSGRIREFPIRLGLLDCDKRLEEVKRKFYDQFSREINENLVSFQTWKVSREDLVEVWRDFRGMRNLEGRLCLEMRVGRKIRDFSEVFAGEVVLIDFEQCGRGFHLTSSIKEPVSRSYSPEKSQKPLVFEENHDYLKRGLCGLTNLGNSCYMNSALQCLSNCREFTQYFLDGRFRRDLNLENKLGSQGRIAQKYAELLRNLWSGNQSFFSPSDLKSLISKKNFGEHSQEDSHEFLVFMLDMLHEDLNRGRSSPQTIPEKDLNSPSISWQNYTKRNNSIVVDTFTGLFKSRILCPGCQTAVLAFDPFLVCPLPIHSVKRKELALKIVRKEATLPIESVVYGFAGDVRMTVGDLFREVQGKLGLEFELFEWDGRNLSPITETLKPLVELKKEIRSHYSSLFAFEKFRKEAPQFLSLLFFSKQANPGSFFGSKISLSTFPRILPLYAEGTPLRLYEAVEAYLKGFPKDLGRREEKRIEKERENEGFWGRLIGGSNKATDFPFKLILKSNNETLLPTSERPFPDKLIELEVLWTSDPPQSFSSFSYVKGLPEIGLTSQEYEPQKVTIQDCLKLFSKNEVLDENNLWHCPKCKTLQKAEKRMEIYQSPMILIFQLKRFKANKESKSKIQEFVEFPVENELDMASFVLNSSLPDRIPAAEPLPDSNSSNETLSNSSRYGRFLARKPTYFIQIQPKRIEDSDEIFEEEEIVTTSTDNTIPKEKPLRVEETTKSRENHPISKVTTSTKIEGNLLVSKVKEPKKERISYELIGVIEHRGGMYGGHYVAKCRNETSKRWYTFDDENVSVLDESEIATENAYILFYRRKKSVL